MTAPRIIIPHGLAADVLRVLQVGEWLGARQIVDAINAAHGVGDGEPGATGFSATWDALRRMAIDKHIDTRLTDWGRGRQWRLPVPVRDEPAEVSGEVGCG
jgi:hypothetical protein